MVVNHIELINRKINTKEVGKGMLTPLAAYKLFKAVRSSYSEVLERYEASVKHNQNDFFLYCGVDIDVLYLNF